LKILPRHGLVSGQPNPSRQNSAHNTQAYHLERALEQRGLMSAERFHGQGWQEERKGGRTRF